MKNLLGVCLLASLTFHSGANAATDENVKKLLADENKQPYHQSMMQVSAPKPLESLQEITGYTETKESISAMPYDIRREALREAALSYGARGGLAARGFEINNELETRSSEMDRVFDFRQLLIAAPSGFMIEPPIITESLNDLLVERDGRKAAVSDAIYRINKNVNIVTAARNWRQYLIQSWSKVEDPPELLRPRDDEERKIWRELVKQGWDEGIVQADDVFERQLATLSADFGGMVRYRQLLAQGMVSQPFAQQIDRGVTGENGAQTMRVGDRAVVITGVPQLITESKRWHPASL